MIGILSNLTACHFFVHRLFEQALKLLVLLSILEAAVTVFQPGFPPPRLPVPLRTSPSSSGISSRRTTRRLSDSLPPTHTRGPTSRGECGEVLMTEVKHLPRFVSSTVMHTRELAWQPACLRVCSIALSASLPVNLCANPNLLYSLTTCLLLCLAALLPSCLPACLRALPACSRLQDVQGFTGEASDSEPGHGEPRGGRCSWSSVLWHSGPCSLCSTSTPLSSAIQLAGPAAGLPQAHYLAMSNREVSVSAVLSASKSA